MGDETLYQELLPHTYTQTHTYTFIDLKKVILASIYPKEMLPVLAYMYLIV